MDECVAGKRLIAFAAEEEGDAAQGEEARRGFGDGRSEKTIGN